MNALGIFLLSSLVFVVSAILEYSAVLLIGGQSQDRSYDHEPERPKSRFTESANKKNRSWSTELRRRVNQSNVIGADGVKGNMDTEALHSVPCTLRSWFAKTHTTRKIDFIAFWVFSTSYVVFILIYWSILSNVSSCFTEPCNEAH